MVHGGTGKNMVLIKDKRGIFFTSLVIVILILFIGTYTLQTEFKTRKDIQNRVSTMNNFLFSVEQDIPRQLHASGFRIIFLFEKRIAERGEFITNFDSTFAELFFNGTMYGEVNDEINTLMNGAKFSDILTSTQDKLSKINVDIELTSPRINVSQVDPWNVKVTLTAGLVMKDKGDIALWDKTLISTTYISIAGFDDPLYTKNTGGMLLNKINQSIYSNFSNAGQLLNEVNNAYYRSSTAGPSFLDRLQGNTGADVNGIESLVNIPELSGATSGISIVDYHYFGDQASGSPVAGMPSWFLIDSGNSGVYSF